MTPITTLAEAETAIGHLTALIEQLTGIVERETVLVRAGELRKASALEPAKAQLAGQLYVGGERLKTNGKYFLRQRRPACAALAKCRRASERYCKKTWSCWRRRIRFPKASCVASRAISPQSVTADLWRDRTRHGA